MINFSGIRRGGLIGKVLRLPLRLLPGGLTMRIWQGRLRGKRWVVGSSNHGCWLGSYEFAKQRLVAATVKPGSVFFDVGAHVGFYTLLAASLVRGGGRVVAFEPLPRNVRYLKRHLELNAVDNVTVFPVAVSDRPGEVRFQEGQASTMGRVDERGTLAVEAVSLDDLYLRGVIPLPDYVKIDVEGGEFLALDGARRLLMIARPTIFLATHGAEVHAQCLALLHSLGYTCRPLDGGNDLRSCDELLATKDPTVTAEGAHRQKTLPLATVV